MKASRLASALARAASNCLPRSRLAVRPPPPAGRGQHRRHDLFDLRLRRVPFAQERAHDHRLDDQGDFFRVGVMGADLRALVGIEKALEQRAEDRRVDEAPVEAGGGEQEADLAVVERQRRAAVEQAAVELGDVLEIEIAAVLHVGEQLLEPFLALLGLARRSLQQLAPDAVRQQSDAVGEEAEHQLIDEMRDRLAVGIAVLQRVRDRLELVGGFLRQLGAGAPRAQLFRIEKDRVEDREILRVGEVVELEFVFGGNLVGPARLDAEEMGVAGDVQRRVLQRRGVAGELLQRLVEIALLLLVFPGEEALLPHVGEAVAAAGLGDALLEGEMVADRIVLGRGRVLDETAEVEKMLLRGRALGERDRLPFADEVLRGHAADDGERSNRLSRFVRPA